MKRITAMILAVVMVLSMATTALAATVTPEFSATSVKAGEDVTVTLKLDETMEKITNFEYRLFFNPELFVLKSSENGVAHAATVITAKAKTDKNTGGTYYGISYVDTTSQGQTINAGVIYTLVFTALEDITEDQDASFELIRKFMVGENDIDIEEGPVENGKVTIEVKVGSEAAKPKLNAPSFNSTMMSATETSITVGAEPDWSQAAILSGSTTAKMVVEISKTENFANILTSKENAMADVLAGNGQVFEFTGLEDGTDYYLRAKVTSVDGYQDSDYSSVVKATTEAAPLPKMTAPSYQSAMTQLTENSITVMFMPDMNQMNALMGSPDAKLVVEISKTENFAQVLKSEEQKITGSNNFTFGDLEAATDYYIRAKVINVTGYEDSDYSSVVKATTVAAPVVEGYTVTMPADISIVTGETASIPVVVDNADGSAYNAFDMSFTYDASKLELTSTEIDGMTVTDENGAVRVQRYGSDLSVGAAAFTLTFEAIGTGETTVTATEAKVGIAENAHELDAADATILDDATVITIGGYSVILPDDFTGESPVAPGDDYTFVAKDKNYNYDVTAKIGDTEITVTDNGDGTFTIPADQITGNIVITSTKEGKTFDVSLGDDMTHTSGTVEVEGVEKVQYMTDYKATLTKADGYTYDLKVKIGGADYTGFSYDEATGVVTIPGADITGKIEFNSNKNEVLPTEYTVTFEGNGAGDVAEGAASKVEAGADYSFSLNKAEGHTYTVSYKMGSSTESVALTEADGKYTIEKVSGNLVITIEKESDLAVEVSTYVELDDKTVFLVRATGTLAEGKAYAYNGDTMYYSNVYQAWSWLVIVEEGNTFTADDAKTNITAVEAEYTTLDQTFDVNMTSKVDVNDAQLVYNIYNCEYSDFSVANMQKFLYADTNGDKIVDTLDAAAVVNNIPKA